MSPRSRIRVAVALLSLWGVPGWAAFEKSIKICQNPTPAQKATLGYLAKEVRQAYESSQCAALYETLATAEKLGILASRDDLDLAPFAELTQLKSLAILGSNRIDLTPLKALKNLTKLTVKSQQITNVQIVAGLTGLKILNLNRNMNAQPPVTPLNLTFLTTLTHLEKLDLSENAIDDITPLVHLTRLRELSLSSNHRISDIRPLSKLLALEELGLLGNKVSDLRPLRNLTQLKTLSLINNKVHDLTPLAGLTALEELILDNNSIEDLSALKSLINLRKLSFSANRVRDVSPLQHLIKLESISMSRNRIEALAPLANLPKLYDLYVFGNPLRDCPSGEVVEIDKGIRCR